MGLLLVDNEHALLNTQLIIPQLLIGPFTSALINLAGYC